MNSGTGERLSAIAQPASAGAAPITSAEEAFAAASTDHI